MVNIQRVLFSFLASTLPPQVPVQSENDPLPPRSVAIVGAGSAGLAMLKTILDLEQFKSRSWTVDLFEERESVAGVWLPDTNETRPPEIPKTPLYPLLHTNTPVPSMTYPDFPFLPGTPLYPSHKHIEAYHLRFARYHDLLNFISFNHKVQKAFWSGNSEQGYWNLSISNGDGHRHYRRFDHLVVASGNHHIPHIPVWKGQDNWLSNSVQNRSRKIIHSMYYRKPEQYTNQSILIVGGGASARDVSSQVVGLARQTFISVRHDGDPFEPGVTVKPDISHFNSSGIFFVDGTSTDPDVVLLGTGYEQRKPFLIEGDELAVDTSARKHSGNSSYPTNALAFIGLPTFIANCPSDIAQSLFAAHAIVNPSILPERRVLLQELAAYESHVRAEGRDPYKNGHAMLTKTEASDYQDKLIQFLKDVNAIPEDGKKFVEQWRRDIYDYQYLKRGWTRIEGLGVGAEWTKGIETELQWADLMQRVNEWQKSWEDGDGIAFRVDMDLGGYTDE